MRERFYRAHVHSRAHGLSEIIALVSHWFIHAVLKQPHVIRDRLPPLLVSIRDVVRQVKWNWTGGESPRSSQRESVIPDRPMKFPR